MTATNRAAIAAALTLTVSAAGEYDSCDATYNKYMVADFSGAAPATEAKLTACLTHITASGSILEEVTLNYTGLTLTAAPALDTLLAGPIA